MDLDMNRIENRVTLCLDVHTHNFFRFTICIRWKNEFTEDQFIAG